jgi:hypothetical protein
LLYPLSSDICQSHSLDWVAFVWFRFRMRSTSRMPLLLLHRSRMGYLVFAISRRSRSRPHVRGFTSRMSSVSEPSIIWKRSRQVWAPYTVQCFTMPVIPPLPKPFMGVSDPVTMTRMRGTNPPSLLSGEDDCEKRSTGCSQIMTRSVPTEELFTRLMWTHGPSPSKSQGTNLSLVAKLDFNENWVAHIDGRCRATWVCFIKSHGDLRPVYPNCVHHKGLEMCRDDSNSGDDHWRSCR